MPRKKEIDRTLEHAAVRVPGALIRVCDLIGTPTDVAPYIANEMRKHNGSQDDINDFYTEVRRCKTLKEAVLIIRKYVRVFER